MKPILGSESEVHAEEERRLQAARRAVALVAEWRLLAERYPATVEPHLSTPADSILQSMVGDLRTSVQWEVQNEQIAITALLRKLSDSPGSPASQLSCETWQSQAVRAADLLWENEQAIEQFYAPTPPGGVIMRDADLLLGLRSLTDTLSSFLGPLCDRR